MGKTVAIVIMLICLFQGLKQFGIIGSDSSSSGKSAKSQKAFGRLLNNWGRESKKTDQIEGEVKNINEARPQDIQADRDQEMRNKFPDISRVFGVDNSRWIVSLSEEDFTILREIKAKLDSGKPLTEEDDSRYRILESKGVIDAIRQNNPSFNQPSQSLTSPDPGVESEQPADEGYSDNNDAQVEENSPVETESVPMEEEIQPEPMTEEPPQEYPQEDTQFNE